MEDSCLWLNHVQWPIHGKAKVSGQCRKTKSCCVSDESTVLQASETQVSPRQGWLRKMLS